MPNSLSPASAYWGDIEINGDNTQANTGTGSQEEFPGLISDGVWTSANTSQLYWTGGFDAFSQQTIKAIPKTADGYGFLEWVEPAGQSLVADREAAETTVTITPEGTNTGNQVELAARFGKLPISTFLTSGDLYFGETLTFTDISTAPSGDGTIVSADYTNDAGLSFSNQGNAIRTYLSSDATISSDNPGDIMDYSKDWTVFLDFTWPVNSATNYDIKALLGRSDNMVNMLTNQCDFRAGDQRLAKHDATITFTRAVLINNATTNQTSCYMLNTANSIVSQVKTRSSFTQDSYLSTNPLYIGSARKSSGAYSYGVPGVVPISYLPDGAESSQYLFESACFLNRAATETEAQEFCNAENLDDLTTLTFYTELYLSLIHI